jgi:hypothetical protein
MYFKAGAQQFKFRYMVARTRETSTEVELRRLNKGE